MSIWTIDHAYFVRANLVSGPMIPQALPLPRERSKMLKLRNAIGASRGNVRMGVAVRLWNGESEVVEKAVAYLILAIMFIKVPGITLVPIGALFLVPLAPLFRQTLIRTKSVRSILAAAIAAVAAGLLMRLVSVHDGLSSSGVANFALILVWLTAFPLLVLAAIWAFERVDLIRGFAVMFFCATPSAFRLDEDWKGSFGIVATLLLLTLVARKRLYLTRLVLTGATVLNSVSSSRTVAAVSLVVLFCTFLRPSQVSWIGRNPRRSILLILFALISLSFALVTAMLSGVLGTDIQTRTLEQTSHGRDLITAGRAEWAATVELFLQRPFGFGVGVTPDSGMQRDAVSAVHFVGGDYLSHYWVTNVFTERVDLHSTLANLWSHFSLGGVGLAAVLGTILIGAVPFAVSVLRSLGAMPLFGILSALWDLMFSPMADSDRLLMGVIAAVVLWRLRQTNCESCPQSIAAIGCNSSSDVMSLEASKGGGSYLRRAPSRGSRRDDELSRRRRPMPR